MPAIQIRDIPETVLAALKRRAASKGRSLQAEIRQHLLLLAQETVDADSWPSLELTLSRAPDGQNWNRSEIYGD